MRFNIVFSLVAHAAIITTAFTLIDRGWTLPVPVGHLTVSLVSGLSEIRALPEDQNKQTNYSTASPAQDKAVSGHSDYVTAVMDKIVSENSLDESHIISPAREENTEKGTSNESGVSAMGLPRLLQARGLSSPSLTTDYQSFPAGITEEGDLAHDKIKTQSKVNNTQDFTMAIRKAIEKVLVYPLFAKKRGLEGTALTEFTINAKGYPEDIRIIKSSGYAILDAAAKQSLSRAAPFTTGKGRYEIPITFTLKND